MKKFNLKLAKQGYPVCTRNGIKARIICFDASNETYPIVALINLKMANLGPADAHFASYEEPKTYTKDGKYSKDGTSPFDLMMLTEKHEEWENINDKRMDIYEKKYNEALKKAEEIIKYYKEHNRDEAAIEDIKEIFPELSESEDERIRTELIRAFKSLNTIKVWNGIERSDILAWLEKQNKKEQQ